MQVATLIRCLLLTVVAAPAVAGTALGQPSRESAATIEGGYAYVETEGVTNLTVSIGTFSLGASRYGLAFTYTTMEPAARGSGANVKRYQEVRRAATSVGKYTRVGRSLTFDQSAATGGLQVQSARLDSRDTIVIQCAIGSNQLALIFRKPGG